MQTVSIGQGWLEAGAAASYKRARAAGMPGGVNSAGRTYAEQAALYKKLGPRIALPPGKSLHETGLAIDLPSGPREWLAKWGKEYGWIRTVAHEPWHFEYRASLDRHIPVPPTVTVPIVTEEYTVQTLDFTDAGRNPVRHKHVDNVQGLLLAAGYGPAGLVGPDGRPDCIGGAATHAALRDFQSRVGLVSDAICGPKTWRALIEF